ncbi:TRAP transporter small permease [Aeromonas caviae]|uniref:TRAP transporter small permease n=1 Tax=Aeromonas caviae TaxID=648 RepID=UPI001BD3583A|nr:TRAP transporter small permease [Aeromonas caviae]MBS4719064.1 TRAP transporter small permease [Aeromonas caviae]
MRLEKFKQPIDRLLAGFTVAVMAMLVVCVVWQVFSRYVLAQPSTMTDEIARFSMIWVGLLGAAYATGKRRHLSIDLFVSDLKGGRKLANQLFVDLCVLLFSSGAMVWGGLTLVTKVYSTGQVSPAMQLPMAYVYAVLPLSGLIISYYCVLFMLETLLDSLAPTPDLATSEENI